MGTSSVLLIRFAQPQDLPRMVDIYNQAILAQNATGDMHPFSVEERKDWFSKFSQDEFPVYVAEQQGSVVGYCYLSPYRPGRQAMARVAEISYYVDYDLHRQGIGEALMEFTIAEARRLQKEVLLAILLDINLPSIRLLEKFNFQRWGHLPEIIQLEKQRCGHVIYGLDLKR